MDAIIAPWDLPTSVLALLPCRERGLPGPDAEAVVACEHEYWSRVVQYASVPEVVRGFDLIADDPLDTVDLEHPFEIKPVNPIPRS